jgi:hypothetical protein
MLALRQHIAHINHIARLSERVHAGGNRFRRRETDVLFKKKHECLLKITLSPIAAVRIDTPYPCPIKSLNDHSTVVLFYGFRNAASAVFFIHCLAYKEK